MALVPIIVVLGAWGVAGAMGAGTSRSGQTAQVPERLTVGFGYRISNLDPDTAGSPHDTSALWLIGGSLYETRLGGKVVPGLAKSYTVSKNGLTWTFTLRSGLKFSNGTPLTSADVKATLDRMKKDKRNIWIGLLGPIKNVAAPNPLTVVFNLKRKYYSLLTVLTEPPFVILPRAGLAQGKKFYQAPISAGPYKVASFGTNGSTYVRNDLYWGPKPLFKEIRFTVIQDPNNRIAQLKAGQIDVADDLPPNLLGQLRQDKSFRTSVDQFYGFTSLNLNNTKPPLDDPRVRRAISYAIDRDQINKVVFLGQNTVMAGFWPPTMTGYDSKIPTKRDVAKAKELLKNTACASGCTIEMLHTEGNAVYTPVSLVIQDNLKDIGITGKLVKLDFDAFIERILPGKYQAAVTSNYDYANTPDGLGLGTLSITGGQKSNRSWYDSDEMEAALEQAILSTGAKRAAALRRVNNLFFRDMPYVNVMAFSSVTGYRFPRSVVNFEPSFVLHVGYEKG
jgi:ABC-type transport system substrate-binding protein